MPAQTMQLLREMKQKGQIAYHLTLDMRRKLTALRQIMAQLPAHALQHLEPVRHWAVIRLQRIVVRYMQILVRPLICHITTRHILFRVVITREYTADL